MAAYGRICAAATSTPTLGQGRATAEAASPHLRTLRASSRQATPTPQAPWPQDGYWSAGAGEGRQRHRRRRGDGGDAAVAEPMMSALGGDTSDVCVVDGEGNAVLLVTSICGLFGSGLMAGETGVLLNNRAAQFSSLPGHLNALAPSHRPRHSFDPAGDGASIPRCSRRWARRWRPAAIVSAIPMPSSASRAVPRCCASIATAPVRSPAWRPAWITDSTGWRWASDPAGAAAGVRSSLRRASAHRGPRPPHSPAAAAAAGPDRPAG